MSEKENLEENEFTKEIIDFFRDLVIIIAIVLFTTQFFVSIFIIKGQSMSSSYYDKEWILVDRFTTNSFWWVKDRDIKRWDVVVVEPWVNKNKKYFIKRIIWLPNEELKIEWGNVFLKKVWEKEFSKLNEKYLNKENYWKTRTDNDSIIYKIPDGKYFVMGDNRNHSSDSRSCFYYSCSSIDRDNYIFEKNVVWKVLLDFGYINFDIQFFDSKWNFNFEYNGIKLTHPVIKEDWKYISTKPKWTNSVDSYNY